jgi:hypothetical protein
MCGLNLRTLRIFFSRQGWVGAPNNQVHIVLVETMLLWLQFVQSVANMHANCQSDTIKIVCATTWNGDNVLIFLSYYVLTCTSQCGSNYSTSPVGRLILIHSLISKIVEFSVNLQGTACLTHSTQKNRNVLIWRNDPFLRILLLVQLKLGLGC